MCDLLKRHDLVPKTRRRPPLSHPGRPLTPMTAPNEIWTADFKGQFKTRDGVYCYSTLAALSKGFFLYALEVDTNRPPAQLRQVLVASPARGQSIGNEQSPSVFPSDSTAGRR